MFLFSGSVSSTSQPSDDNPTYVYDHRGLKVRKDSLTKQTEDDEAEEERDKSRQSTASSPRCSYSCLCNAEHELHAVL